MLSASVSNCPACGGALIADPEAGTQSSTQISIQTSAQPQADHRGIVLPPRHAVGGVITPR
jgi:hypothetical protein